MNNMSPSDNRMKFGSMLPWLGLAGIAVGLLVYVLFFEPPPRTDQMGPNHPAVGKKLSRLEVAPLTGDPPPIAADDLPGRVTMINYWGTWCGPCVQEFPHMAQFEKSHRGSNDFRFVSISVPSDDPNRDNLVRETQHFLANSGSDLPTYAEANLRQEASAMAAVDLPDVLPTTIILDRQGIIRGVWNGYEPGFERQMAALLDKLLRPDAK